MKQVLVLFISVLCMSFLGSCRTDTQRSLLILHTNDTHSQIEPKADGTGGYARRMGLINKEREKNPNLLLVDAGDFCQGTPYFNFFHGRVEVEALNRMGYDAVTLGNHEFDNGIDTLAAILQDAAFPVVCANYDVTDTPLEGLVRPYVVLNKGDVRVGVFGLGVDPEGLIAMHNFLPLVYLDPLPIANNIAAQLKEEEGCDVVVCLSHLGTEGKMEGDICDKFIAANSRNIDVIIGGHTHKVYQNLYITDLDGKSVLLSQTGKSGAAVGKITVALAEVE